MVGNVIVQCEILLISIFQFLRPQKNMKFINFSKTLKKLHIVGNLVVKFELFFALTKKFGVDL